MLILWHLEQPRRFGELRRLVHGISEKVLISQLRELEADGIIERKDYQEVPTKVDYSLTPFGKTLKTALSPLSDWARNT